jgi:hypothetical protein
VARPVREGRFPDLIDTLREVHVISAWNDADRGRRPPASATGIGHQALRSVRATDEWYQ